MRVSCLVALNHPFLLLLLILFLILILIPLGIRMLEGIKIKNKIRIKKESVKLWLSV